MLETGVFFIASQAPLLPILCVKTNRIITIARPGMQTNTAINAYGGFTSRMRNYINGRLASQRPWRDPVEPINNRIAD